MAAVFPSIPAIRREIVSVPSTTISPSQDDRDLLQLFTRWKAARSADEACLERYMAAEDRWSAMPVGCADANEASGLRAAGESMVATFREKQALCGAIARISAKTLDGLRAKAVLTIDAAGGVEAAHQTIAAEGAGAAALSMSLGLLGEDLV